MNFSKTVYIIAGPTAAGKTAVAIALAQRLHTCIVSADSRQCYIETTIGTAKPSGEELQSVKHYFINAYSVTVPLTAADFEKLALAYLQEIFQNHDTAVVCGGTGLYIKALCEGLDDMPETDEAIAEQVNADYRHKGFHWLQQSVEAEDPEFYETGETQNPARLARALIFKRSTGESITGYQTGKKKERDFNIIKIGLELPREVLYNRINHRVDRMMQQGLLEEAKLLYPYKHLKNLQTVGYAELFGYLDGQYSLNEAVNKIKQHTRNYAKRQMTWFKRDNEINWLNVADEKLISQILELNKKHPI